MCAFPHIPRFVDFALPRADGLTPRCAAVRILGPQPGARVRSGRVVSVVIRVSALGHQVDGESFPQELHDGEEFPPGWVLVLSQDGQPPQTVGRKVCVRVRIRR